MRIKRLEILNIASIESAVIDFDKQPLSDAELFLITGTTGAGKTTILDAICLALYNTTPRIAKGATRDFQVNRDGLTGVDPRNMMRQNTGEAYSKVYFTGNDAKEYCAEWSVQRGKKKKPSSELSNAVWSIENLTTGESASGDTSKKQDEVKRIITDAVGLDFNQFCRTTMLAQGEFTEFLKSDEDAKAAILEKISGSGIYRKIGAEIFNQFSQAKRRLDAEQEKHAQITVLDKEERKGKEEELILIDKELAQIGTAMDSILSCIGWLETENALKEKCEVAKQNMETAAANVKSEEFIRLEHDVRQWNETIDVRGALMNSIMHKDAVIKANGKLRALERDFTEAAAARAYMQQWLDSKAGELQKMEEFAQSQAANTEAYRQSQTIIANIKAQMAALGDLAGKKDELKRETEENLPKAEEILEVSFKQLDAIMAAVESSGKELERIKGEVGEFDLSGKRNEKDFLTQVAAIKKSVEENTISVLNAEKSIRGKEAELAILKENETKERAELERLQLEHQRRRVTIDTFAQQMRSMLHQGLGDEENLCPVCGQKVTSLPSDAVLDSEYKKIEAEFKVQQEKAATASNAIIKTGNMISLEKDALAQIQKKLNEDTLQLEEMITGREDADLLRNLAQKEILEKIESLAQLVAKGEELDARFRKISLDYTKLLEEKGEAETKYTNDKNGVDNIKGKIVRLNDEMKTLSRNADELAGKIDNMLAGTLPWENQPHENPLGFISELSAKAAEYDANAKNIEKTRLGINTAGTVLENVDKIRKQIMDLMPGWNDREIEPAEKSNMQELWINLVGNVLSQLQAIEKCKKIGEKYSYEIESFLGTNPQYSMERISALNRINLQVHNANAEFVNSRKTEVESCTAQYFSAQKDLASHLERKPETLAEEMSLETLNATKSGYDAQRDAHNVRKGVLEKEIKDDDLAIQQKGDTTQLDKLKEEYEKWRSFNKEFGDSEGKVLSRIAQSYVLGTLLNAANKYLKNMAPRYSLLVNPGTLNLKLEDKYNGFSTRSTNSISGGESFLVSLALALALADFGQHLGVSMLFIDEGFGTLSGEALQNAINTLKTLHTDVGRQVGIISHREEIRENIPVQIKVNLAPGTSTSTVEVLG